MFHEMQLGTRGPHVTVLHAFLCGAVPLPGIEMDQHYGEVTARAVAQLQRKLGGPADGNCFGEDTRAAVMGRFGFDFDAACEAIKYRPVEGVRTRSAGAGT